MGILNLLALISLLSDPEGKDLRRWLLATANGNETDFKKSNALNRANALHPLLYQQHRIAPGNRSPAQSRHAVSN
jgi:hypothetical protein